VKVLSLVTLTINNKQIQVEEGTTILEAAKLLNIKIPTLCHLNLHDTKMVNKTASCRVCMVEVEGRRNLAPSCATPVFNGMVVKTNSIRAIKARRNVVELLLSDHPKDCLVCEKNTDCELQKIAADLGIDDNNLELIMSVPIQITVELGKTKKKIKDIAELTVGNIVELNRQAGDQVDVVANGRLIAKGDVVVVDDNYSVRITEIIKAKETSFNENK
jgi:flagellar motor switch protein FliN